MKKQKSTSWRGQRTVLCSDGQQGRTSAASRLTWCLLATWSSPPHHPRAGPLLFRPQRTCQNCIDSSNNICSTICCENFPLPLVRHDPPPPPHHPGQTIKESVLCECRKDQNIANFFCSKFEINPSVGSVIMTI